MCKNECMVEEYITLIKKTAKGNKTNFIIKR